MKILFINSVCGTGSTGKICAELAEKYEKEGNEVKIAFGRHGYVPDRYQKYAVRIGNDLGVKLHAINTKITDRHGLASKKATKEFLKWADEYSPDLLWLHNIHGYYINYEMLFEWIKKHPTLEVKWTLHDCWAFTGHCCYFDMVRCENWRSGCKACPQKASYPSSIILSNSESNLKRKQAAFSGVNNMTVITPSKWLADLVKQSYLGEYPVEVVYNTINTEVFKKTMGDFRARYGLENKRIILGVASIWERRKGLDDFIRLSEMLDKKYTVVLVGLSEKQLKELPANIVGIKRTNGQRELAEIYTSADVFVNPTYEDNYPTVNLEAKACGTPVITYRTGGSPESVEPENVVEVGDVLGLYERIKAIAGE